MHCWTDYRFRAAAVQKPVIDWASFVLTADNPAFFSRYWFGEYPWEDPQAFWSRSPLSLVGNVRTPALVVVGDGNNKDCLGACLQKKASTG